MKNFIELNYYDTTDKLLIRVDKIVSVVDYGDSSFIVTKVGIKRNLGFWVDEKYEEIKRKIAEVES